MAEPSTPRQTHVARTPTKPLRGKAHEIFRALSRGAPLVAMQGLIAQEPWCMCLEDNGDSPLLRAVRLGCNAGVLQLLCENGANLADLDSSGCGVVAVAMQSWMRRESTAALFQKLELLCKAGAAVNEVGAEGLTAMDAVIAASDWRAEIPDWHGVRLFTPAPRDQTSAKTLHRMRCLLWLQDHGGHTSGAEDRSEEGRELVEAFREFLRDRQALMATRGHVVWDGSIVQSAVQKFVLGDVWPDLLPLCVVEDAARF